MRRAWVIAGFTGSGKTTALRHLKDLDKENNFFDQYIDLDEYFTTHFKSPELFIKEYGFDSFREKERELLLGLISDSSPKLIALGGGALTHENYLSLRQGSAGILGIKSDFVNCWARIQDDQSRPITNLKEEEIVKLFQAREEISAKSDVLVHNNSGLEMFYAELHKWYSCQAALN